MAKKNITNKAHYEQINLALAYIHYHFKENITAQDLANVSGYSIFHFHRIFKEITGENVNDYLRNARLEKASNLLLYNQHQTVETIAQDSGFATAMGFRTAFKKKFGLTPSKWRKNGYEKNSIISQNVDMNISINEPEIVDNDEKPIMYVIEYGYKKDVQKIWSYLIQWSKDKGVLNTYHRYLGLFHKLPSFEFDETTRYVACIETKQDVYRSGKVGKCLINKGKFAKFNFTCRHEELYHLIYLAYIKWLPTSKYEIRNFPAYAEYKNPEALLTNDILEIDFYMPIQLSF